MRTSGTVKLDTADLRGLVEQPHSAGRGKVIAEGGGGQHWTVDEETQDLMIDVELVPSGEVVTCTVLSGAGIYYVPPVGATVAVIVPAGDPNAGGICLGVIESGLAPGQAATDTVVITRSAAPAPRAAREGDTVQVTIPIGTVLVMVLGTPTPNPTPITVDGVITSGSDFARIGD